MNLEPINQRRLYGIGNNLTEFIRLYQNNNLPNKILLSGQKGIGKSTLAFHLVNFILSIDEISKYDVENFEINENNRSFKLVVNNSNPNLILIDVNKDKKFIDINQIRNLILNLNKSAFNNKPRFVLIDNIEFLNLNSINALLKVLEEPSKNVFFILINNGKKILSTLLSRCLNFRISISNSESLAISEKLLGKKIDELLNKDLLNYFFTPGNIYELIKFGHINKIDLIKLELNELLNIIIKDNYYKKDLLNKYLIFDLIENYLRKNISKFSSDFFDNYYFFIKKISDTKRFNLDEESLFIEFQEKVLNG